LTPEKKVDVSQNYENSVVVNRIACGDARDQKENLDKDFGTIWQQVIWGGKIPQTQNPNQMIKVATSNADLNGPTSGELSIE